MVGDWGEIKSDKIFGGANNCRWGKVWEKVCRILRKTVKGKKRARIKAIRRGINVTRNVRESD